MEMQTLKDSSNPVFVVTDLLRGVRYFVADKGSHYEIQVPRKAGYIKVAVSPEADVIDIADKLIRSLDTTKSVCFTSHASVQSSLSSLVRTTCPTHMQKQSKLRAAANHNVADSSEILRIVDGRYAVDSQVRYL